MCKENINCNKALKWLFIALMVVSLIVSVVFFWLAEIPVLKDIGKMRTTVECSLKVAPQDSAKITSLVQRLDSLQDELSSIRDQYQMDIDIGIDRLNSWVGFWLAILALILLLAGVWQYMQVRRYDGEWEKLKGDLNKEKEELQKQSKDIEADFSKLQTEYYKLKEKFQLENTIFNLLRTMSAIHDPMMLLQDDNRKQLIIDYLDKSQELLKRYTSYTKKISENDSGEDYSFVYALILANFRLSLCRSLVLFTTPNANVKTRLFLQELENQEKKIRQTKKVEENVLDSFNTKLGELIACYKMS